MGWSIPTSRLSYRKGVGMKLKENLNISTSDFWYDLTDGGYLNPGEMLEDQADIDRVNNAIAVLMEFKDACNSQIEDFNR